MERLDERIRKEDPAKRRGFERVRGKEPRRPPTLRVLKKKPWALQNRGKEGRTNVKHHK